MICLCILWREHPKAQSKVVLEKPEIEPATPEAYSTMRALGVLSSAFSLNASARHGACKRSRFKSIGISPENPRWLPKQ